MKSTLILLLFALTAGCSSLNTNAFNTYRNSALDLEIGYPQDWVITDYVDWEEQHGKVIYNYYVEQISEEANTESWREYTQEYKGEGVTFQIANHPAPYGGFTITNIPENLKMINVSVVDMLDYSYFQEKEVDSETGYGVQEKVVYEVGGGRDLTLYISDYPEGYTGFREGHESAYAVYDGINHDFLFHLGGWGFTDEDLEVYKDVLATFKELN